MVGHGSSCFSRASFPSSPGIHSSAGALISDQWRSCFPYHSVARTAPKDITDLYSPRFCGKSFLMSPLPPLIVLPQDPTQGTPT